MSFVLLLIAGFALSVQGQGPLIQYPFYFDQNNNNVPQSQFKASSIKIIVHGWNDESTTLNAMGWVTDMKKALYDAERNIGVIVVNWNSLPKNIDFNDPKNNVLYVSSAKSVPNVGQELADILNKVKQPNQKIHCIGHSLGAHVCGFAGKFSQSKYGIQFDRISGLDPAGPNFFSATSAQRLDKTDAKFVDIYFTSKLGLQSSIGHANFYANDNTLQPNCGIGGLQCNHARAYIYYVSSIQDQNCFTPYTKDGNQGTIKAGYYSTKPAADTDYIFSTTGDNKFCCKSRKTTGIFTSGCYLYCSYVCAD